MKHRHGIGSSSVEPAQHSTDRPKRRQRRGATLALALSCALAIPVAMPAAAQDTVSNWVEAQYGTGAFTAKVVSPPTIVDCEVVTVLGAVSVVWVDFTPVASVDQVEWTMGPTTGSMTGVSPAISDQGGGVYRATFGAVLFTLLGAYTLIGADTLENGWTSDKAYSRVWIALLGLGGDCTPNFQP